MSKMRNLAVGLTVTISLTSVLAACSTKKETPQATVDPASSAIQFPLKDKVTLKAFSNKAVQVKKDYNEMATFKKLEQETNVHIEWTSVATNALLEKRNLLFASNDLPDIFYGANVLPKDDILKAANQGQIVPIEKLIDQYAPNFKKILAQRPDLKKSITASDGHIYTIPTLYEELNNTNQDALWINKKWLDKLGLKMPTTTDEFNQVLKAFKEKDPNGNGKADEIPFSFRYTNAKNPNIIQGMSSLSGPFGPVDSKANEHLFIENGKVAYTPMTAGYKEFAKYMNKLNSEGLLDPEAFTQNAQVYTSKITAKEPVLGAYFIWGQFDLFGKEDTDYVPVPPLKGPSGHQEWQKQNLRMETGSFAITKVNKHPEASIKWMDTMLDEKWSVQMFWGPFGINMKETNGKYETLPTPAGTTYIDFRMSEAPGSSASVIILKETNDKVIPNGNNAEKAKLRAIYAPYQTKEIFPQVLFTLEDSDKLNAISGDLINYTEDTLANWIFKGGIDAGWDAYLAQLKKMNIDEYVSLYQKTYDRYKNTK